MNAPHSFPRQTGYTLIEIMIVVAIIGILAVIAIPSYQRYIAQGEVGSGLATIAPLKSEVESRFGRGEDAASITIAGIGSQPNANALGTMDMSFDADGTGEISFTYGASSSARVSGGSLVLSRTESGTWTCSTVGGVENFKPQGCD